MRIVFDAILAIAALCALIAGLIYHLTGDNGNACFYMLMAIFIFITLGD